MLSLGAMAAFGVIVAFNFLIIYWKYREERFADMTLDLAIFAAISYLFSNTITGLVIGMIASMLVSLFLLIFPPSFSNA